MKRLAWLLLLIASQAQAAIVYIGTGAVSSTSGTVSFAIPAGSVGDLIICTAAHYNPNYTLPTPSSAVYTELASGSTYIFHKVWARIATGTDTFTLTSPSGYLNGSCSRFSGTSTDLTSIVDVASIKRTTLTTVRVAAMTPTHDNELLFYSLRAKAPGAGTSLAAPTSFTERTDTYYSAADLLTSTGNWIQTTATAIAQQDIAITPTPAAAQSNTAIVLALQPSGTGGGGGGGIWSLVGYGTAAGANSGAVTPSLPTGHTAGDWLCWTGIERNTANTLAQPAGYTQVVARQVSGHDVSAIDCKIDSGGESAPSTTLVGVGITQIVAFRGGPATITGVNATNVLTNTCTSAPPQPSLTITSYGALVISFTEVGALYGTYNANTVAPAGFATGAANVSVNSFSGSSDISNLLSYYIYPLNTTLSAGTYTITNASAVACTGLAAAIISSSVAPTITDVNVTNTFTSTATGLVITGTSFGASQGTGSVKIIDGANSCTETVTAWTDTSITFTAVLGNCRYGSRSIRVTTNSGTSATKDVAVQAPSGKCYFDLTTLLQPFTVDAFGAPNRFGDAANDINDNSQLEFSNMTFTGGSTCANITINTDGSYKVPVDLTTLDWLWNDGSAGWTDTGVSRTGQGKIHISESNGFRLSCSNAGSNGIPPPVRSTATKSICASGCDYPNTTTGIQNCMSAIANGQSCEMRSATSDGSSDIWAARIALSSISGASGSPKTLRVLDGDSIILSLATSGTTALLSLTNVNHVNIQGNSNGRDGLHIGNPAAWLFTCAQSPSSATFVGPTNCYTNAKNTLITGSTNIGLMNLSLHGASSAIASEFDNASDYIYLRQALVDLHGVNDDRASPTPGESGNLLNVNSKHFISEDSTFSHGGISAVKITGSFAILRRVTGDGSWDDLTGNSTYSGTDPIQIRTNDCSSASFGCAPYGPVLIEDSEIIHSGLTAGNPAYNAAMRLSGLGVIFRKNYIYSNTKNYLLSLCGTTDASSIAYSEGEQSVYNNTFWGGASFWTTAGGYPAGISTSICQNAIIADNLFQGNQPGLKSASEVYAFTAGMNGVPIGTATNQWKGWKVFNNIFGLDTGNPSLNMQVTLTGTGAATKALTDSATWPSNFYTNRNITETWVNGTTVPGQSKSGLVLSTTSTAGVGDNAPITTTTNAGAPSATINVVSARPFKDDWGFSSHTFGGFHTEYGDCIAIGPLTTSTIVDAIPVRLATVNYAINNLTTISTMTFQSGSPVWKAIDNGDGSCGRAYQNRGAAQ